MGELLEALDASQQNVSKHLGVLLQAWSGFEDETGDLGVLCNRG